MEGEQSRRMEQRWKENWASLRNVGSVHQGLIISPPHTHTHTHKTPLILFQVYLFRSIQWPSLNKQWIAEQKTMTEWMNQSDATPQVHWWNILRKENIKHLHYWRRESVIWQEVRERETERDRETERQRDRDRERESEREDKIDNLQPSRPEYPRTNQNMT